jgi:hypothetical protein
MKAVCFAAVRGSGIFGDLYFLGAANNFSCPIYVETSFGATSMWSAGGGRLHKAEIEPIGMEDGDYCLIWDAAAGGTAALIRQERIDEARRAAGGRAAERTDWDALEDLMKAFEYPYPGSVKIKPAGRGDGSDFLAFMVRTGIGMRLSFLEALRGREWEARYEDSTRPVLFMSGNRAAVIKPLGCPGGGEAE